MSYTIAIAGKGGTGKTTVASLIVRNLIKGGISPVLAVDADPNSNLAEAFGVQVETTIGGILFEFLEKKIDIPAGMTKESYIELKMNSSVAESRDVDFLVLGRKHGPGCYCYPNVVLKNFVEKLSGNYRYVVIDNEAGMEHLSRRNVEVVDLFIVVSDHTVRGLRAAKRISALADELNIAIIKRILIVNRFREENGELLDPAVKETGMKKVYTIADDPEVLRADVDRISVMELPDDAHSVKAISGILNDAVGEAVVDQGGKL
jgi:CO dehydrogenase maturation factor